MKKNAPKILAIILLSVIAVLMVLVGTGNAGDLFGKNDNVANGSAGADDDKPDKPDAPEPPQSDDGTTADSLDNVYFPVPPEASALYAYTQSLWSETGMSLDGAIGTSMGQYVIVTHSAESGVLKGDGRRISVVRSEPDGTLTGAIHLGAGNQNIRYLCSKLTACGLVVVAADGERSYVYTISTDLKNSELLELPAFNSVTVFALSDGFLLAGTGVSNAVYKIAANAITASTSLGAGRIAEIYDFGSYYTFVLDGISCYSVAKIDIDLNLISMITISDRQLLAILPTVIGGVQKFLVAEKTSGGVELVRYGSSFKVSECERVGVGLADSAEVFMNGSSVFALLKSTTDRLYIIDENLDFTASSTSVFGGMSELYDYALYDGGFFALYSVGGTLVLNEIRNDGTSERRNLAFGTEKAFLLRSEEGKLSVVYACENGVKIIGL